MGLTLLVVIVLAHVVGSISLRVSGIPFAMVTLAFAQAGSRAGGPQPGRATGGDEGLTLRTDNLPDFLVGVVNTRNLYWLALAVLVVVFVIVTWVQSSRAGHVAAAVRENELRVRVLGLQPYLVKLLIFVVSAVLVCIVGMVFLLLQSGAVPRAVSADFTITLLVMVVLGGVGSRWGAVIGGVFYTLLDQRLTALAQLGRHRRAAGHPAHPAVGTAVHPGHPVHPGGALPARRPDGHCPAAGPAPQPARRAPRAEVPRASWRRPHDQHNNRARRTDCTPWAAGPPTAAWPPRPDRDRRPRGHPAATRELERAGRDPRRGGCTPPATAPATGSPP